MFNVETDIARREIIVNPANNVNFIFPFTRGSLKKVCRCSINLLLVSITMYLFLLRIKGIDEYDTVKDLISDVMADGSW
jgi:hypothetical protein